MYALDTETGLERWRFQTRNDVFSSPVIGDGAVYFGSDDSRMYALE